MDTKTAQHTPGPWEARDTATGIEVYPVCDAVNATFQRDNELMRIEAEANARLIAVAPEYHAAVEMAQDSAAPLDAESDPNGPVVISAEAYNCLVAAYDKAEGSPS